MSTRGISMGATRPIPRASHTGGTLPDLYYPTTYSSAAYEQDVNLSPPATFSPLANLALGERPLFGAIRAPFEDRKITQALIDVAAVVVAFLLILVTSLSIVGSLFILFFVEI